MEAKHLQNFLNNPRTSEYKELYLKMSYICTIPLFILFLYSFCVNFVVQKFMLKPNTMGLKLYRQKFCKQ